MSIQSVISKLAKLCMWGKPITSKEEVGSTIADAFLRTETSSKTNTTLTTTRHAGGLSSGCMNDITRL